MNYIVSQILQAIVTGETVRFINSYRGIPVSYPGQVFEVTNVVGRFVTNVNQIVCARMERQIVITSNLLPRAVKANIITSDLLKGRITLGAFQYASNNAGKRKSIRVEPREPIKVSITTPNEKIGQAAEISVNGIGVYIRRADFSAKLFESGKQVEVVFELPSESNICRIRTRGVIRHIFERRPETPIIRVGVQTYPDKENEMFLSRYIGSRQAELMRELHEICVQETERARRNLPSIFPP